MIYITSIIFTLILVFYQKYQFLANRGVSNDKYHPLGLALRAAFFLPFLGLILGFTTNLKDLILALILNGFLFDVLINVIALGVRPFYVGTTSVFDKTIGKFKWIIWAILLVGAIVYKFI